MKKMKLVLVMVLAMALTIPMAAYAAADLTVTGDTTVRTTFGLNAAEEYELQGSWRTRANLELRAGSDNITGYAKYILRNDGFQAFAGSAALLDGDIGKVDQAYVDFQGALIPGAPDTKLRVGRFNAGRINDWVLNAGNRDSIHLTGLVLGPADIQLYNGWIGASNTSAAISGNVSVDMVELSGTYVSHNDRIADVQSADYAVGASVTPGSGISFEGEFASDGANNATAWKVGGELATVPNMTLRASTWNTADGFLPARRHNTNREHLSFDRTWGGTSRGTAWGDPWIASGFSIGATTTQAGLPIDVNYKSGTVFGAGLPGASAGNEGAAMSVIDVGTTLAGIETDVAFTTLAGTDPVTDITASKTLAGLPVGGDVTLAGAIRLRGGVSNFGADATWAAPNGLNLGLHYANYDRVADWNHNRSNDNLNEGIDVGAPNQADGFSVTAGYSLGF